MIESRGLAVVEHESLADDATQQAWRTRRRDRQQRAVPVRVFQPRPDPVTPPKLRCEFEVVRIEDTAGSVFQIFVSAPDETRRDVAGIESDIVMNRRAGADSIERGI